MDLAPDFDEFCALLIERRVESQIDGVTWDEVWQGRTTGALGSRTVAFIGRDAFLKNKKAAGRPKDLADIDALREVEGSGPNH